VDVIVSGTILAGLCAPCCAKSELGVKDYSCMSACVIVGVGFLQLLLTACLLIGWVWSAIWGIALIGIACKYLNFHNANLVLITQHVYNFDTFRSNLF
jgi:hypothetical protein